MLNSAKHVPRCSPDCSSRNGYPCDCGSKCVAAPSGPIGNRHGGKVDAFVRDFFQERADEVLAGKPPPDSYEARLLSFPVEAYTELQKAESSAGYQPEPKLVKIGDQAWTMRAAAVVLGVAAVIVFLAGYLVGWLL